jgi:hypothetical protein
LLRVLLRYNNHHGGAIFFLAIIGWLLLEASRPARTVVQASQPIFWQGHLLSTRLLHAHRRKWFPLDGQYFALTTTTTTTQAELSLLACSHGNQATQNEAVQIL